MRRNAVLAVTTALACGAGMVAVAAPAHAASWRNIGSTALGYNGSNDRVDFASKGVGWTVGAAGSFFNPQAKIIRWNGSAWVAQASPVGFTPTDVAAASASKAWIVGYSLGGTLGLYWNGTKWAKVAWPGGVTLPTQVAAAPDGTAYSIGGLDSSAGGVSAILRWTGTAWTDAKVPLPASSSITAVDVKAKNNVWLAGTTTSGTAVTGLVMHFNGSTWRTIKIPGSVGVPAYQAVMHRIVVNSPTNVYVLRVKQNAQVTNALLHYNGSTWRTVNTPLNAAGIGLSSDGKSGVVMLPITTGTKTQYMHYSGTAWTTLNGPARTGTVQAGDLDWRPGTTALVSAGTASTPEKKTPFIEYFG